MDGSAFDALVRGAGTVAGRRAVVAALAGGLLGLAGARGGRVDAGGKNTFQKQCDAWTERCAGGVEHMCGIMYPPGSRPGEFADCTQRCGACCQAGTCASREDVAYAKSITTLCLDFGCPA